MYYAIYIDERAIPQQMFGPVSWNDAIEHAVEMAQRMMGLDDTAELRDSIENGGPVSEYRIDSVYIIMAE